MQRARIRKDEIDVRVYERHRAEGAALARVVLAWTVLSAFASAAQTEEPNTQTSETAAPGAESAHGQPAPLPPSDVAPQEWEPENPSPSPGAWVRPARRMDRLYWAPLALAMGVIALEYETALGDKTSWHLGGALAAFPGVIAVSPMPRFELTTGVRFFPGHNDLAPQGLWLGVGGLLWYVESPAFGAGLQGMIGYTFGNDHGPTASIGAGARAVVVTAGGYVLTLVTPGLHLNFGF
jgi:hypothetical protein